MWVDRTKHVLPSVWAGIQEGSLVRVSLQEKARHLEDCLAGDTGNHEKCASFDLWAGLCVQEPLDLTEEEGVVLGVSSLVLFCVVLCGKL